MDPFEEFEFKPLTDGLGFHKKKSSSKQTHQESPDFSLNKGNNKRHSLDLINEPFANPLNPPLPRKQTPAQNLMTEINPITKKENESPSAVENILQTLQKNNRYNFSNDKKSHHSGPTLKASYKKSRWMLTSSLLDAMLVLAMSLLCMIIGLILTKIDLVASLTSPETQIDVALATFALFAFVSFTYLVLNRIFLGWTPGEWAFEQRIGQLEELHSNSYSLKIVLRSALVILTGFIVFPILSLITRKDLAGMISGAHLYIKA